MEDFLQRMSNHQKNKEILHFKDVEQYATIKILDAQKCNTKYGETVMVHTDESVMFLPKRFAVMSAEDVAELGSGKYQLVKESPDGKPTKFRIEAIK